MRTTTKEKERTNRVKEISLQIKRLSAELFLLTGGSADPSLIKRIVTEIFKCPPDSIGRSNDVVFSKYAYTYCLKKYTRLTDTQISENTGGTEHSTTHYRYRTAKNLLETHDLFRDKLERTVEKIELLM